MIPHKTLLQTIAGWLGHHIDSLGYWMHDRADALFYFSEGRPR